MKKAYANTTLTTTPTLEPHSSWKMKNLHLEQIHVFIDTNSKRIYFSAREVMLAAGGTRISRNKVYDTLAMPNKLIAVVKVFAEKKRLSMVSPSAAMEILKVSNFPYAKDVELQIMEIVQSITERCKEEIVIDDVEDVGEVFDRHTRTEDDKCTSGERENVGINELTIFSNEEFGEIRTIKINGEPWFVGKDVAKVLGIVIPRMRYLHT